MKLNSFVQSKVEKNTDQIQIKAKRCTLDFEILKSVIRQTAETIKNVSSADKVGVANANLSNRLAMGADRLLAEKIQETYDPFLLCRKRFFAIGKQPL